MEDLIIEYLNLNYRLIDNFTIFLKKYGEKTYHKRIVDNLSKSFLLEKHIAEGYLVMFIMDKNSNFEWRHFKYDLPPKKLTINPDWLDLHLIRFNGIPNDNRQYIVGIDPVNNNDMLYAMMFAFQNGRIEHLIPNRHYYENNV